MSYCIACPRDSDWTCAGCSDEVCDECSQQCEKCLDVFCLECASEGCSICTDPLKALTELGDPLDDGDGPKGGESIRA